jgi:DNA-binding SARP family transcriptional activator
MTGPDGRVRIGGAKERLVLALLVLRAGEVVSRDALVDALWADHPPATAVKTMQGYVARVRKALDAAGMPGLMVTRAPGYVLHASSQATDVVSFEAHARAGHMALVAGDGARARMELSRGLEQWRGEALADCRGGGWATTEALRLDEQRLVTLEDRVDADLMLGAHGAAVGELESLVARYPLRERLWAALMLALYRSGRQADAVRAYQRAREVLVGELGLEPGHELRRLEAAILVGDPSLDAPTLVGRAAEVVIPLPRLVRAASSTVFVGRAQERDHLHEALQAAAAGERRIVLVSGEPGIGKTALSAAFAHEAFDNGASVLFGRCEEGLATPYQLFREALAHYVAHASEHDLAGHVAVHRSELVRLVPALASRIAGLPPSNATDTDTERFLLFAATVGLLTMASAHRPMVLVFDDLQWADGASLSLLRHLVVAEQPLRVLIVGTYRDGEVPQASALR